MNPHNPATSIRTVELDKTQFQCIMGIPPRIELYDARAEILRTATDGLLLRLRAAVLGETLDEHDYVFPADWWEAVKERFAPAWLKRRYPVKTVSVRATVKALYPHLKAPQLDGHHKSVRITLLERGRADLYKDD